jgi:hypothetical protein
MSILETPRIYFAGEMSWDPIVTNNYQANYDEDSCWTVFDAGESVEQFRQSAITKSSVFRPPVGIGNWNPMGTHRSSFFNTEISGVDTGSGPDQNDSFVNCPAYFSGMLVDCEPYGAFSSQLFFDTMSLGIDGGCQIFLPRKTRFTARYINFFRLPGLVYKYAASIASVVWQASFEKSNELLRIEPYDSAALKALKSAMDDDNVLGLTVRFNAYSTRYYGAEKTSEIGALEQALVTNLAGGGFQPNPARSQIVGTVGLWRKGEPAHEPGDRAMLAQASGPPKFVGSASARLDGYTLTVDMSNSISETDLQYTKQDLGPLSFYATGTGGDTLLGTIDYSKYDRKAYLASSGIVTLSLNATQAQAAGDGILELRDQAGTTYLEEQAMRAIPNDPNLYIDFGQNTTTEVLVLNKGEHVGKDTVVMMELTGVSTPQSTSAKTDDNGIATFNITGTQGQVEGYVLVPDSVTPITTVPSINPQVTTYIYIRTYPGNDTIAELEPTWENVYKFCLANWNAMAPCMDNWLDLKDPVQVKAYASVLKRLTDPANFEAFRFMPVTRDMTDVERQLLYRFLDGDGAASGEPESAPEEKAPSLADLSRQMRQAE